MESGITRLRAQSIRASILPLPIGHFDERSSSRDSIDPQGLLTLERVYSFVFSSRYRYKDIVPLLSGYPAFYNSRKSWWFRVSASQFPAISYKRKRVRRPLQRRLSKQCLYLHEWALKDSLRLSDTRDQHADLLTWHTGSIPHAYRPMHFDLHARAHTRIVFLWYADALFPGAASASHRCIAFSILSMEINYRSLPSQPHLTRRFVPSPTHF